MVKLAAIAAALCVWLLAWLSVCVCVYVRLLFRFIVRPLANERMLFTFDHTIHQSECEWERVEGIITGVWNLLFSSRFFSSSCIRYSLPSAYFSFGSFSFSFCFQIINRYNFCFVIISYLLIYSIHILVERI